MATPSNLLCPSHIRKANNRLPKLHRPFLQLLRFKSNLKTLLLFKKLLKKKQRKKRRSNLRQLSVFFLLFSSFFFFFFLLSFFLSCLLFVLSVVVRSLLSATIRVRLPSGQELRSDFSCNCTLQDIVAFVAHQQKLPTSAFLLSTTYPFRTFRPEEYSTVSLPQAGNETLCPISCSHS
jgi:hypothetical protein